MENDDDIAMKMKYLEWCATLTTEVVSLPECICGNRRSFSHVAGFYVCNCTDGSDHWFRFDCAIKQWVEDPNPFALTVAEN